MTKLYLYRIKYGKQNFVLKINFALKVNIYTALKNKKISRRYKLYFVKSKEKRYTTLTRLTRLGRFCNHRVEDYISCRIIYK